MATVTKPIAYVFVAIRTGINRNDYVKGKKEENGNAFGIFRDPQKPDEFVLLEKEVFELAYLVLIEDTKQVLDHQLLHGDEPSIFAQFKKTIDHYKDLYDVKSFERDVCDCWIMMSLKFEQYYGDANYLGYNPLNLVDYFGGLVGAKRKMDWDHLLQITGEAQQVGPYDSVQQMARIFSYLHQNRNNLKIEVDSSYLSDSRLNIVGVDVETFGTGMKKNYMPSIGAAVVPACIDLELLEHLTSTKHVNTFAERIVQPAGTEVMASTAKFFLENPQRMALIDAIKNPHEASEVMANFRTWLIVNSMNVDLLIVSWPAFDAQWIFYYFEKYLGWICPYPWVDMKSYYWGFFKETSSISLIKIPKLLKSRIEHDHRAKTDATDEVIVMLKLFRYDQLSQKSGY